MSNKIPGFCNNLLDSVSVNTNGSPFPIQDKTIKNIYVSATSFGGGTVTIQWSLDPDALTPIWTTAKDIFGTDMVFTANKNVTTLSLYGAYYRAILTGSSGASNVCARLV